MQMNTFQNNIWKYLFWSHTPCCGSEKDIHPKNPETSTVSGFFAAHFLMWNREIFFLPGRTCTRTLPIEGDFCENFSQKSPFFHAQIVNFL